MIRVFSIDLQILAHYYKNIQTLHILLSAIFAIPNKSIIMKLETPKETSIPKLTAFNVSAKKNRILSLDLSVFTSKSVLQIDDA